MYKKRRTQRHSAQKWGKALPEWRWCFLGVMLSVLDEFHKTPVCGYALLCRPVFPSFLSVLVYSYPQVFSVPQGPISGHLFVLSLHLTSSHATCFPCRALLPYLRSTRCPSLQHVLIHTVDCRLDYRLCTARDGTISSPELGPTSCISVHTHTLPYPYFHSLGVHRPRR